MAKDGSAKNCPAQINTPEITSTEVSGAEISSTQVGTLEISFTQVSSTLQLHLFGGRWLWSQCDVWLKS